MNIGIALLYGDSEQFEVTPLFPIEALLASLFLLLPGIAGLILPVLALFQIVALWTVFGLFIAGLFTNVVTLAFCYLTETPAFGLILAGAFALTVCQVGVMVL